MIGYIGNERRTFNSFGFGKSVAQLDRARNNVKKKYGRKVKCLNDGKEFSSINEVCRYYQISNTSVIKSATKHIEVTSRGRNDTYRFEFSDEQKEVV